MEFVAKKVVFGSTWLIKNAIFALKSKSLPLSLFHYCADVPLKMLWDPFAISACEPLRHGQKGKWHFDVRESSVAEQLCISPPEIPVEGRIQDGVKG